MIYLLILAALSGYSFYIVFRAVYKETLRVYKEGSVINLIGHVIVLLAVASGAITSAMKIMCAVSNYIRCM